MTTVAVPTARSSSCSTAVGAERTLVTAPKAAKNVSLMAGNGLKANDGVKALCWDGSLGHVGFTEVFMSDNRGSYSLGLDCRLAPELPHALLNHHQSVSGEQGLHTNTLVYPGPNASSCIRQGSYS